MKLCMHSAYIISPLFWFCIHEGCEELIALSVVLISFACFFSSSSIFLIESSQRTSRYQKRACAAQQLQSTAAALQQSTSTASYSDRITFFGFSSWQRRVCCLVDKSRGSQGLMNRCCRIADRVWWILTPESQDTISLVLSDRGAHVD